MAKAASFQLKFDTRRIAAQFQGLSGRHPGLWPAMPRAIMMIAMFAAIVTAGYAVYWRGLFDELGIGITQEEQLKVEYTDKVKQAVNLPVLRKQKEQVSQFVSQLEKQLPSKAEMDALLSDINQAGLGRSLQFELFRPGQIAVRNYYAELPIVLRVSGKYHDIGAFASDIANLSRIVTLNNLTVLPRPDGTLTMDATAKTFRYLDPQEVAAQRKVAGGAKK